MNFTSANSKIILFPKNDYYCSRFRYIAFTRKVLKKNQIFFFLNESLDSNDLWKYSSNWLAVFSNDSVYCRKGFKLWKLFDSTQKPVLGIIGIIGTVK